jgi:DNA-binding XRE family transcriptional regulator
MIEIASDISKHYGQGAHYVKMGKLPFARKSPRMDNVPMPKLKDSVPGTLPDRQVVGARLMAMREALGLTRSTLADQIDCDRGTYGKFEKAQRDLTLQVAWRIHNLYGFTLDYLFDGKAHGIPGDKRDAVLSYLRSPA